MDLFSFLLFTYLDDASSKPTIDTDLAAQQIEQFLPSDEGLAAEEGQAIQSYLQMDFDARRDLNPAIHEWMLERITHKPSSVTLEQVRQVAEAFFIAGPPTLPLLAVNALLAISANYDTPQSLVNMIWASMSDQPHLIEGLNMLTDILLDLHFLSTERNRVNQALREFVNMHRILEQTERAHLGEVLQFTETLRERLVHRAESLSPELARELRAIAQRQDYRER